MSLIQKCTNCNLFYKQPNMKQLNCQKHYLCNSCVPKNNVQYCDQCQIVISSGSNQSERQLRNYPIQGIMVHHDKIYNPQGQSQFTNRRNCYQRTNGWILCHFLAIVFFFSGLAMAIKTSQKGTGVIMTILGVIGIVASIFFLCKIRAIDRYYQSGGSINQDNFIYIKNQRNQHIQRRTISSATTERN